MSQFARIVFTILFFVWVSPANAQTHFQVSSGPGTIVSPVQRPAFDHYDVVAIRVEFQPDSSLFSTGDGTFGGTLFEGVEPPKVDPLPHDDAYFEAHLEFLENYIRRVSDERTLVSTHLLPVIVRVSGTMADYAPIGPDDDSGVQRAKLARLIDEAWTLAGQIDSFDMPDTIDPERTAFVLFHAGVGRDVELLGTTLDKTPEDLPSLYFSYETLEALLPGFDVTVDGVPITNTLVIPRTETRRGIDFIRDQPFLAELSINGMLASSFLSYLGVPDLFDTSTGESAIGPFGVMDGLGIFAYSGLLPPEPSAWTKLFLGWADLVIGDPADGGQTARLLHAGSQTANDVFLAPIASNEYFLVENRNRDAENDGLNLTVWNGGAYSTVHFDHGDDTFNSNTVSGFPGGVIVDADNLDFALPGGRDEDGNLLIGGILIWHIDEARLIAGMPTNSVNADRGKRAVDLEEADGAEDIGYPSLGLFGPSFNVGSPFDFFYEGNPTVVVTQTGAEVRLYENRFGPDTYPNTASNSGGVSFVELAEFSPPGPEMTFSYANVAEEGLTPRGDVAFAFEVDDPAMSDVDALYFMDGPGVDFAAFGRDAEESGVLAWSKNGDTAGTARSLYDTLPVQSEFGLTVLGPGGFARLGYDGSFELLATLPPDLNLIRTTTPLVELLNGRVVVGAEDDEGPLILAAYLGNVTVERTSSRVRSIAVIDGLREVHVFDGRADIPSLGRSWEFAPIGSVTTIQAAFSRYVDGLAGVVPDPDNRRILILLHDGGQREIRLDSYSFLGVEGALNPLPIFADLDDDRMPDVLMTIGEWMMAVNLDGAVLDGFPIQIRTATEVQPLLVRRAEDGPLLALISGGDGRVDAYDFESRTHAVRGFPLPVGSGLGASPIASGTGLMAVSSSGQVRRWDFDELDRIVWGQSRGDRNNSFIELPDPVLEGGFLQPATEGRVLAKGESYNWPNPVSNGVTWIRFKPLAAADVEITIVDLAGQLIDRFEVPDVPGGLSSEIQWQTTAGSGIYFTRITATTESGISETHLVKMAIVR